MLALIAVTVASLRSCPVEQARYVLRGDQGVTASFRVVDSGRDWPSGLAMAVHHRRSGKTYWWLPWVGGTDGLQNVASTEDVIAKGWRPPNPDGGPRPYGDRQYLGFDRHYNVIDYWLRRGSTGPAHMLFLNSAGAGDTAFPVKQFFDLVGCSAKHH